MNFRFFHPIAAFALAKDPVLESSLQKRAQSGVYCSQKPFPQVFFTIRASRICVYNARTAPGLLIF